ncbi:MAG: DinB superfamily protein [Chlorobi bacterium]|nr:DinB superfamily protein [Chlorobiota bacterium]
MAIAESILPEFDQEMANTRKLLAIVPEEHASWKPHEKSTAMGALALHLANIPTWAGFTLTKTELNMKPNAGEEGSGFVPPKYESMTDTLEQFDKNVAEARQVIASTSDEEMMVPWTLLQGEHKIFTLPRIAVLRSFVMSHSIHHRGQLDVYLRLKDVPLPGIYGPSADSPN